jgi:hypothetical protein
VAGGLVRRILGREPEPEPSSPRVPTSEDLLASLDQVEVMVRDAAVPPFLESRVERVAHTVRDTIPRLGSLGAGSAQAYAVMATATDYLPDAVAGYLRLPRDWADTRPVDHGRTPLMILVDQLDLLAATMDRVFDAVCRADATALIAHGRFLQEKFGASSTGGALSAVSVGAPSGPPGRGPTAPDEGRAGAPSALTEDEDTGPIQLPRLRPPGSGTGT